MDYRKAWLTWGAATLTSFAVLEAAALRSPAPNATLSANLREAFGFTPQPSHAPWRRLAFYAGVGWLTWHIADPLGQWMHDAHRRM